MMWTKTKWTSIALLIVLLTVPLCVHAQWTQVNPQTTGRYDGVCYVDANTILVGDRHETIHRSVDGGQTWQTQQQFDVWASIIWFSDIEFSDTGFGTACNIDGEMFYSNDYGETWETAIDDLYGNNFNIYTPDGTDDAYVAGKNAVGNPFFFVTTDGWQTYSGYEVPFIIGDVQYFGTAYDITSPDGGNTLYMVIGGGGDGVYGQILSSTDGGMTWTVLENLDVIPYAMDFADSQNGLVVGSYLDQDTMIFTSKIYRTTDGGQTWDVVYNTTGFNFLDMAYADQNTAYAVGSLGTILETVDSGVSWTSIESGTTNDLYSIDFLDANHGVIAGDFNDILLYGDNVNGTPAQLDCRANDNLPLIIPGEGGNLVYDAYFTSNIDMSAQVWYWTEVWYCDGQQWGPTMRVPVNIIPFMDTSVFALTQYIPQQAPWGDYHFWAHIGYMNGPKVSDGIGFKKQPSLPGPDSNPVAHQGFYAMQGVSGDGNANVALDEWKATGDLSPLMGDADESAVNELPSEYTIGKCYPNPFNAMTNVSVTLPETAKLNITVHNVLGEQVTQLASGTFNAGDHTFTFNANDLPSGVYFIQAQVPGKLNQMQKITLLK